MEEREKKVHWWCQGRERGTVNAKNKLKYLSGG
jgi:hypothetical protein